jgi:hypothetical protein
VDAQAGDQPTTSGGAPTLFQRVRSWPTEHDLGTVLVVCCRTGFGTTHSGVVFRNGASRWMIFHQAWHKDTRYEPLDDALVSMDVRGFLFAVLELPQPIAQNLKRFCHSVAKHPQSVPYAFGIDDNASWDDATGRLTMPDGKGLTCVNFVTLLFKSAGLVVVDTTDWPDRDEDKQFQEKLLQLLENTCRRHSPGRQLTEADQQHLQDVKKEIELGCVRIRSEELVGAVLSPQKRPSHVVAIPAGAKVCQLLDAFATAATR